MIELKKYPLYTKKQNEEWGNLFETMEYGSFEHNIFDKLYYKGYQIFYKSETIYQEVADKLRRFVPSVPFDVKETDKLSIEIDIKC